MGTKFITQSFVTRATTCTYNYPLHNNITGWHGAVHPSSTTHTSFTPPLTHPSFTTNTLGLAPCLLPSNLERSRACVKV